MSPFNISRISPVGLLMWTMRINLPFCRLFGANYQVIFRRMVAEWPPGFGPIRLH